MLPTTGFNEFMFLLLIIIVLSWSGLWPVVLRALRQLRGEAVEDPPPPSKHDVEVCCRLLGVSPSAPWEEVERAYRRKAKIHHPDLGGDEDAMRALNEAYAILKRLRRG
ncbi:MAG TPA: J domain-containing protein [Candidatus Hydrogenedentes bacterium]|nr:J domain-containing protein [Candidatus Hydrogenedentota bacterium]HNT89966.1 J domain-containing protein [Candidatus Hydrogenedentota bacterium]